MGLTVVRVFNQSRAELQARFLGPMQRGEAFTFEEHQWIPREMRVSILEGPKLEMHQLTVGGGWPNARRTGTDVTEQVLTQVGLGRSKGAAEAAAAEAPVAASATGEAPTGSAGAGSVLPAEASIALRERLIGRLSAGPASLPGVVRVAAELLPERRPDEVLAAAVTAVNKLLDAGRAELELDGKALSNADERAALLDDIRSWLGGDGDLRLIAAR
jgi:hypothetical protein